MAYSDLQNNQTVSFNNLQSGVNQGTFTAKTGIPTSNKQVTKAEANVYVNINTSLPSYVAKASNRLITKQDLSGITVVSSYLMYGVAGTVGYKSIDGGNTFTAISGLPSLFWKAIAGDSTGTYIAAINRNQNQVYVSNNGGASFTSTNLSGASFYPTSVAMSNNGQFIAVAGVTSFTESTSSLTFGVSNARISVSLNYGASFSGNYVDSVSENLHDTPKISVSGNGQYITAVFSHVVDPGFPNNPRPFSFRVYSSNYGASWTKSGSTEFNSFLDIAISYTGQYQFITSDFFRPGVFGGAGIKAYVSNNYGISFTERFSNTGSYIFGANQYQGFVSATISDDGKSMVGATNGVSLFIGSTLPPTIIASNNYGITQFLGYPNFTQTQGFLGTVGIAGGNAVTTGVTNNYIAMMLYQIGQFNYSINGGFTFVPKVTTSYNWYQIYRKAFIYTVNSNPAYGTFLYDQCIECDLYAFRADGNGGAYQAEVIQYNTEVCCAVSGGGGGGGNIE